MRDGVLDDLDSEITELTDLVNELVAVASGELEVQPNERIDLPALVTDVAERVGRRRSRDIEVEIIARASVDAPRTALDRAVTNLVDNACKFDQTGGAITVRIDGGTLTVLDSGPGIAPGEEATDLRSVPPLRGGAVDARIRTGPVDRARGRRTRRRNGRCDESCRRRRRDRVHPSGVSRLAGGALSRREFRYSLNRCPARRVRVPC